MPIAPFVGIGDSDLKFIYWPANPPQFFDLASYPDEMQNSGVNPAYPDTIALISNLMNSQVEFGRVEAEVRELKAWRHIVYAALRQGVIIFGVIEARFNWRLIAAGVIIGLKISEE